MPVTKKVVKKAALAGSRSSSRVTVGQFGADPVTVTVSGSATVGDVLSKAGFDVSSSEKIWLNGKRATKSTRVRTGDIVSVISPKEAGSN